MFGKRKALAATPFDHSVDCRTPDARPEWSYMGNGRWERVCSCNTDYTYSESDEVDPNSPAAEPSWSAHEHALSCEATGIAAVVKIERREGGAGWRSTCAVCTTHCIYFWDPDRTDQRGRPISREANVRYRYETRHQLVAP